jgi:hypothetical protein
VQVLDKKYPILEITHIRQNGLFWKYARLSRLADIRQIVLGGLARFANICQTVWQVLARLANICQWPFLRKTAPKQQQIKFFQGLANLANLASLASTKFPKTGKC